MHVLLRDSEALTCENGTPAQPNLLQSLVRFSLVGRGLHAVRFFVEGSWLTVLVDDLIPVSASGQPIFGRCRQPHHIWVQIFEKAFAKLCGSFQAIELVPTW